MNYKMIKIKYSKYNLMKFALILISLIMIFSYSTGHASAAASNATIYVNSSSGYDGWNGEYATYQPGTNNGPKLTIRNATGTVASGGTINIANGQYTGNNNTNITINNNMTLIGQSETSTIINGNGIDWIFSIPSGIILTIDDLTITNGTSTVYEMGAILNEGNLTINSCNFTNNTAPNDGGAIDSYDGTLTVNSSTFINNVATDTGGAIDNEVGTLTVNGSNFTSNTALVGGAIYNDFSNLNVNGSTFINNKASDEGGAIFAENGILNVISSNFTDNTATYIGGAICNYDTSNITGNTFTNNTAYNEGSVIFNYEYAIVNFNRIVGNSYTTSGNAIYDYNGLVNASLNWWGSNANPSSYVTGDVTVTPWLVLTITANPTTIPNNGTSTITVDLLHDSNTIIHDPTNGHVPDGTPMTFTSTLGTTINPSSTTINGITESTLNSGIIAGLATVSATVDNQTVTTSVVILDTIPPTASASPSTGVYNSTQNVALTMNEPGTIYYTTDGTTPTFNSNRYLNPIPITTNTTLEFFAMDLAGNTSPIYTDTYIINTTPLTASADPVGGVYNSTQNVALTMNRPGTIYYTTDGTTPTFNSNRYLNPIPITTNTTLEFYAMDLNGNTSPIYTNTYTINTIPLNATANPAGGIFNSTQNVALTMNRPGTIYYTTNGSTPTFNSNRYTSPIIIATNTTLEFFAMDLNGNTSPIYTNTYTINTIPLNATANPAGGIFNSTQNVALTMNRPGTIYYTTNGSTPTFNSNRYTSPIIIATNTTLEFFAMDLTGNVSPVYTDKYVISPKVTSSNPVNNALNVPTNQVITVNFTEPITSGTTYANITLKTSTGTVVNITKSINGNVLTIKLSSGTLTEGVKYTLTLPVNSVKDLAGNGLNTVYTVTFTVTKT